MKKKLYDFLKEQIDVFIGSRSNMGYEILVNNEKTVDKENGFYKRYENDKGEEILDPVMYSDYSKVQVVYIHEQKIYYIIHPNLYKEYNVIDSKTINKAQLFGFHGNEDLVINENIFIEGIPTTINKSNLSKFNYNMNLFVSRRYNLKENIQLNELQEYEELLNAKENDLKVMKKEYIVLESIYKKIEQDSEVDQNVKDISKDNLNKAKNILVGEISLYNKLSQEIVKEKMDFIIKNILEEIN